jgi:transposase-like protein
VDTPRFVLEELTVADKSVRYTPEFKRQMVELARTGRTPASLAQEFRPTPWSIATWVKQAARGSGKGDGGLTSAEREESMLEKAEMRYGMFFEADKYV